MPIAAHTVPDVETAPIVHRLAWQPFQVPALPYAIGALAPTISAKALALHHGRHHRAYVAALNRAIHRTEYAGLSLARLIVATFKREEHHVIYRNAAQAWNHSFLWHSMRPDGGGTPPSSLRRRMVDSFGSVAGCKRALADVASDHFGSGWAWLVLDAGVLKARATADADSPLTAGVTPLLAIDLWEHAYYLDHHEHRDDYVAAVIDRLVDWGFAGRMAERRSVTQA